MSVHIMALQINNRDTSQRIAEVIRSETAKLADEYEVSIFNDVPNNSWNLVIRQPHGDAVTRPLYGNQGDLAPAIFRVRLRELLKLL
jgi:hypothetical protein